MNKKLIVVGMITIAELFYLITRHYTVGDEAWCAVDPWNNKQCYYETRQDCLEVVALPNSIWERCEGR